MSSDIQRRTLPYLGVASIIGLFGAFAVAAVIFMLDWAAGHPLATPNVLGSKLLRGENLGFGSPIQPGLVFGYTLVHTVSFVIAAAAAVSAQAVLTKRGVPLERQLMLGAVGMFVGLEVIFAMMLSLIGEIEDVEFGFARIAAANAVAAITMATLIYRRARSLAPSRDAAR